MKLGKWIEQHPVRPEFNAELNVWIDNKGSDKSIDADFDGLESWLEDRLGKSGLEPKKRYKAVLTKQEELGSADVRPDHDQRGDAAGLVHTQDARGRHATWDQVGPLVPAPYFPDQPAPHRSLSRLGGSALTEVTRPAPLTV